MDIPLYGGSVGQTGVGSSTGDFEIRWKGLWRCSVPLCGSCVKGTWREGCLAGDPEGYVEKSLETGISFHRGPVCGIWWRARLPRTLRKRWRGLWGWGFSLWRGSVEGAWGNLIHWGPWKICSDSLRIRASLHRGPNGTEGNLCLGGCGNLLCWRLWKMDDGGLLYWGTLRYVK